MRLVVVGSRADDEDESRGNVDFERHLHSQPSAPTPPNRMWANVLRVSGKRGTGTLITSSSTRTQSRLPPRPPPLPAATPALAGSHGQHGRLGLAPSSSSFSIRRFFITSTRVLSAVSDGPSPSSTSSSAATTTSFEDPSRTGLFYHLVPPPTPLSDSRPAFALSLLADPPPSSESSTVLGWLPAETPGDDRVAGLNDFVENRACSIPPSRCLALA